MRCGPGFTPDRGLIIQEAMYGFIMALTFVTVAKLGIVRYERENLIIAIIMMDFVWGVIDLIIFYNLDVKQAHDRRSMLRRLYESDNKEEMRQEVYCSINGTVFDDLDEKSKLKAVDLIMNASVQNTDGQRLDNRNYLLSAICAFATTILSAVPSVLCILLIGDLGTACTAAATVSSFALFFIGYFMNEGPKQKRIVSGVLMAGTTMALTVFAAYFGG